MPSIWNRVSTPRSGELLAVYAGSPASALTLGGIVHRVEVIETFGDGSIVPDGQPRWGQPLLADGVTLWIEGFFPTGTDGLPIASDRDDILATWDTLRTKLALADYHFFLHYEPGDTPLFRRYQAVNTVLLRSHWADQLGFLYQLAAVTTNHTLSSTAVEETP